MHIINLMLNSESLINWLWVLMLGWWSGIALPPGLVFLFILFILKVFMSLNIFMSLFSRLSIHVALFHFLLFLLFLIFLLLLFLLFNLIFFFLILLFIDLLLTWYSISLNIFPHLIQQFLLIFILAADWHPAW